MQPVPECLVWSYSFCGFVGEPPTEFTVFPDDAHKFTAQGAAHYVMIPGNIDKIGPAVAIIEVLPDPARMRQLVGALIERGMGNGPYPSHGVTG